MNGKLSAAVAGLVCSLTFGVAPALAGGNDNPIGSMVQSLTQTQSASNSVNQDAQAQSTSVNLAPNIAILNSGDTNQSSGSNADSSAQNTNDSSQGNAQSQDAGQQGGGQDASQSQTAANSVDQSAQSKAEALNVAPNVAILNSGDTNQSSSASADANASNRNRSTQGNDQSQVAHQGDQHDGCGCTSGKDGRSSTGKQSQDAQNTIDQSADARAKSVNLAPNVAIGNSGDTNQSSHASATANASNQNRAEQENWQSQRSGGGNGWGSESKGSKSDQSQTADNSIDQSASSKSTSVNAAPNFAVLNGYTSRRRCDDQPGGTNQSSGSSATAYASNGNESKQWNWQSQGAKETGRNVDQSQTASNDVTQSTESKATAKNWAPNLAFGNRGWTDQSSWSGASSDAGNWNRSSQENGQMQESGKRERRCCS